MGVTIIIVNYNVANEVKDCINSIFKFVTDIFFEIIVVDNNSSDRNIESLKELYPQVRFELLRENLGYSKANNYAVRFSTYDYILFLNPDTVMIESFLPNFIDFASSNVNIGACAPMLLYNNLTYQNSWGYKLGIIYEMAEAWMFINIYRKILKLLNHKNYKKEISFRVNWMSGSCLFVRKDIFEKANMFDEDYFLNYEDIDLQFRIKSLGFKILYNPLFSVKHLKRSSIRTFSGENLYYYHMTRSNLIYMYKHFGYIKRNLVRGLQLIGIVIRILSLLFRKAFVKKRKQKLSQYLLKMKQYLSFKNQIFKSSYFIAALTDENKKQIIYKDSFWQ